jgi:uncharacterized repeat protein (TIGR03803 family)
MKRFCRALLLLAIAVAILLSVAMQAQTFTVLHTFTGANDGRKPQASLTLDSVGNIYGTAPYGGGNGMGTVFKMTNRPSGWMLTTLYSFTGGSDGAMPLGGVVFGPDGSLYGNTSAGANPACNHGCGAVYNLRPQPRVCNSTACPWLETTLYGFIGGLNGGEPLGNLLFNAAGGIYGTTEEGTAYVLTPSTHSWIYHLISYLPGHSYAGLISDTAGNLFGTTYDGGGGLCYRGISCGTVFELTPVGSSWHLNVLHSFQGGNDGGFPLGALVSDRFGNLYGANSGGTVFMLTPAGGNWTFKVLYQLPGPCQIGIGPSCGSWGSLAMDASGALYGTAYSDGAYLYGSVFKLTPSNGSWIYTDLHDFTGGSDGAAPEAGVTLDTRGNIYGTTAGGGSSGSGVVFEIAP